MWSVEEGMRAFWCPFRKVGGDLIVDALGVSVWLLPGVRELLDELSRRDVIVSLASANDEEPNKVIRLKCSLSCSG
ncbi:MAG: hypothetical protein KIH01_08435 [Candidatus Freyarchaeota archaeon]|nr:hypothetical protein [Candidatus Jordarchaeia archaeon]